jgi:chromosome segregation ATPase
MSIPFFVRVGLSAILLVPLVFGQGRNFGGMQGQGRQGQGRLPGVGNQDRARLRVHATQQQQDRYRVCSRTMNRLRKRVRTMARIVSASNFSLQQAQQLHEQIAKDLRAMTEQQQSFAESLSDEQRTANQKRLQQVAEKHRDLEFLSDALGFELEQASTTEGKTQERLQEQVGKMEQLSRSLEKQQQELAADLGLDE